ncbi:MAG TPA: glycoside hydrolase family 97 protein [Bacteroidales bacterium]|nr:glycoside hydrolase family 97 protein [Bacteroidales bacterium]
MKLMQNFYVSFLLAVGILILSGSCRNKSVESVDLISPDSSIRIQCYIDDSLSGQLQYTVFYKGHQIIKPSGIELYLKDQPLIKNNLEIVSVSSDTVNEKWERVWGKRKHVLNRYNRIVLELKERSKPNRRLNIHFRAYNDGIALRYELPVQKGMDTIILANEKIEFSFDADHPVWATFWNTFHLSQEVEFSSSKLSVITERNIIGTPLLIHAGDAWLALLEADVTDWACSGFTADPNKPNTLISKPSWLPDDTTVVVKTALQRESPWKVVMIAEKPGKLIESDIIQNLNDPCALDDVSWIKPGVSAWDWWWSGRYAPDAGFSPGPNTETMKYYIDFAAEMGWQYQLVDWQWYGPPFKEDGSFNMDADITKMIPEIDIPEIIRYAKSKNISTVIWLLWPNADKQMEEAFALYEKWGVSGIKIDFMDRNDQEMVNFYHRVAKTAAKHHLVVDFHGAYVPDGFSRTYPNLITREGILGNEYNKWSNRITPQHCLTIPFTRMLAGEMDFTPGGFLNDNPQNFVVVGGDSPAPHVMGTRCFQLAMFVVYESAFQVFCESPFNVRNQPGSEFLKAIPSSWDETRVLEGMPGEYIAVARRSGNKWYMAGMSVSKRSFEISTDFLDNKTFKVTLWSDSPDAGKNPRKLLKSDFDCSNSSTIKAEVAAGGGFVAIFETR